MTGTITRRGKASWRLKFDIGRDPATGKRLTRYVTVRGKKQDAQRELNRLLHQLDEGTFVEPSKLTVAEYLRKWLSDHAANAVSAKTHERYTELVDHHMIPHLGATLLRKVTPLQIQSAYQAALTSGRRKGDGGLSPRTVHSIHRVLFQALRQAVRWQLLSRNPAEAVDPPSPAAAEIQVLTESELATLIKTAKSTRLYLPILIAGTTGLRRGEILGLRWQDVDIEGARLTVNQAIEQTKKGIAFKAPKTKRSRRAVTLPSIAVDALKDHKRQQAKERLSLGLGKDPRNLVFTQAMGEPVNPRAFSKEFTRIVRRAKVAPITFHGLRHTHLTHLLRSGVHPKVASERAGHASVAVTLDIYSHVMPGMQEDVARGVDAALRTALEQ